MKNYYSILAINNTADLLTIKKTYRKLAIQYHPDKNSSIEASKKFIKITEAFHVLRNMESRKQYDAIFTSSLAKTSSPDFTNQKETWKQEGKQKAKEYSSIPIDDFIKRIIDEVQIVARYSVNFLLIAFCLFAVVTSPTAFSIDPFLGIFCLILYSGLGYLLFNRTKEAYQKDRKNKFNN